MIYRSNIVKFPIELHTEMGRIDLRRFFAPADRKINAGVIHHQPDIRLLLTSFAADGRLAGIERLPLIPVVPNGIGDHRILGYKNPYIQKFDVHQKASFLEPNRRERSVRVNS